MSQDVKEKMESKAKPEDAKTGAAAQRVVDPDYLILEAPRKKEFITGSEAAKESVRRANVDIAIAYPITPQSETMQQVGYLYAEGYIKDYYRGEEEIGVMSAVAGASRAGVRVLTATAGPGLMRGIEQIVSWPGGRLPSMLLVMCRVVNAPLAIQPDNIEISYLLNSGGIVLHGENQQDFYDYPLIGFMVGEKPEVTLPVAVAVDGFFVTHARGWVSMPAEDIKLPPRDCYHEAVPMMDNENPPIRISRDSPIQKSNFISYQMHAAWQQEVWAAQERAKKWLNRWLGGLIEVVNPGAKTMIVASGAAVSQGREAVRQATEKGLDVGLIKIKSIRPFPTEELIEALEHTEKIVIPEFNYVGWLAKEVKAAIDRTDRIIAGPRVFGGMTMPTELILETISASE
ncbi:Pyruvate:ferredoxin oxidoreductase, alpha subunit [hydrothermal vent metagenome]|uniref:Pyruvate:ferredoxin oxidoreductase, alpha subunit n=1 Tax=hydrothermal vent metagenome TaxID=652676 RepID=A0A3B1DF61_9ZZZZ